MLNVTVTGAQGTGFITVYPCGQAVPTTSNLNFVTGDTVPNAVIVKLGAGGKVCLFAAESATHLIADVNGYFPAGSGFERCRRAACWILVRGSRRSTVSSPGSVCGRRTR